MCMRWLLLMLSLQHMKFQFYNQYKAFVSFQFGVFSPIFILGKFPDEKCKKKSRGQTARVNVFIVYDLLHVFCLLFAETTQNFYITHRRLSISKKKSVMKRNRAELESYGMESNCEKCTKCQVYAVPVLLLCYNFPFSCCHDFVWIFCEDFSRFMSFEWLTLFRGIGIVFILFPPKK